MDKFFSDITGAYLMAVFGITLAPLLEELFFRGMLYPLIRRAWGVAPGVVLTGAAFASIHGAQLGYAWGPLLSIFVVGVVFTLVRERTDSVAASFLMHCGYNFTLFGMLWVGSDHFRHLEKVAQLKMVSWRSMGNAREKLLAMLAEKSFRLGNFKLSSGGTSDYYIDCRLTTLDAAGALATGRSRAAGDPRARLAGGRDWRADHGSRSDRGGDFGDQRAAGHADQRLPGAQERRRRTARDSASRASARRVRAW